MSKTLKETQDYILELQKEYNISDKSIKEFLEKTQHVSPSVGRHRFSKRQRFFIKFFKAVEKITPKVTWRRVDIRPDRRPPWVRQQNQGSITARVLSEDNSTKATTRVGFNGTLRVIGFDGKIVPAKQKGGRK